MVCQCLTVSIHPFPVTTRVPGYRPNWALVPVIIIQPEACRKLQGAASWVPYISDPWVKKSSSLWNCFCNLYRKQKFREHKTSAIFITLWSFKILVNLVYYSCIAILIVCTGYFLLLSLKIISMYWHSLLIFNSDGNYSIVMYSSLLKHSSIAERLGSLIFHYYKRCHFKHFINTTFFSSFGM